MTFKSLLIIPLLAAIPVVTGCGGSCDSVCDDAQDCPGATKVNCDDACGKSETLAEDAGCSDQYDDMINCLGDMNDICSDKDTSCDSKVSAYVGCALPYCMNASHAAQCEALEIDFGGHT